MSDVPHALRRDAQKPALTEEAVQRTWRAVSARRARSSRRPARLATSSLVFVTVVLIALMMWAAPLLAPRSRGAPLLLGGSEAGPKELSVAVATMAGSPEITGAPSEPGSSVLAIEASQKAAPADEGAVRQAAAAKVPKAGSGSRLPARSPAWRALALSGDYKGSYQSLGEDGFRRESRSADVETLLLLADIARLSGHPADGAAVLSRIVREYPSDPRASLSAFTLGRLLLDSLGQPERAAAAFKVALDLGLGAALAEDARAGIVEALARAGDGAGARTAAIDYEQRFPGGRRLKDVRRWAALE